VGQTKIRDRSAHIYRGRVTFDEHGGLPDGGPPDFWVGLSPHRDRLVHIIRHAAAEGDHLSTTLYHWLDGRLWTQNVHLVGHRGEVDVHLRAPLPALGPPRDEPLVEQIIDHAADVLLMTEASPLSAPGPRIVFANAAFARMTGYEVGEVIGLSPRILQGDGSEPEVLDFMGGKLRAWEDFEAEITNYRKDGKPFVVHLDIRSVRDPTGWVTHWVATQRDITPQRLSRAGLRPPASTERKSELRRLGHGLNDAHTTILGNVEVAREASPPGLRPLLEDIESAVVQAHQLTRRLFKLLGEGESEAGTSTGLSLLWMDDDPMVRSVAQRIGAARGWEVQVASDAEAVIREAGERSFDLIILDRFTLDGSSREDLGAQLRAMGVSSPILWAVSQRTGEEPLDPDCIGKPFRLAELDEVVRRLVILG